MNSLAELVVYFNHFDMFKDLSTLNLRQKHLYSNPCVTIDVQNTEITSHIHIYTHTSTHAHAHTHTHTLCTYLMAVWPADLCVCEMNSFTALDPRA